MSRREITFRPDFPPVTIEVLKVTNMACHWHNCLEVIWVLSGNISIKESYMMYHLSAGDVYLVNYNETHKITTDGTPADVAFVYIDHGYFSKYIPNLKEITFTHYCFSKNYEVKDKLKNCRTYMMSLYDLLSYETDVKEPGEKAESLTHSFLRLLIDIFQYIYFEKNGDKYLDTLDNSNNLSPEQMKRIHRLTYYIYTHCNSKLTLDDLAGTEFYSRFYMSHFIKRAYGLSYQDTLSLCRVGISERVLIGTDKTLDEIASISGFSNRNQYSRQFKKWHGISPSQYRAENSKDSPGNIDLIFNCDDELIKSLFNRCI